MCSVSSSAIRHRGARGRAAETILCWYLFWRVYSDGPPCRRSMSEGGTMMWFPVSGCKVTPKTQLEDENFSSDLILLSFGTFVRSFYRVGMDDPLRWNKGTDTLLRFCNENGNKDPVLLEKEFSEIKNKERIKVNVTDMSNLIGVRRRINTRMRSR
ncbi:hypothetical protein NPIL_280951 [Nephila pilipes]|uniref:Uncharacterized protein n=1 Tax=Nephila pilipes TaxID=299642 RepID=A0A8X6IIR8_NEPPI|nr:hypothetical protein NPIL_280951 [Nephila pilipes]